MKPQCANEQFTMLYLSLFWMFSPVLSLAFVVGFVTLVLLETLLTLAGDPSFTCFFS